MAGFTRLEGLVAWLDRNNGEPEAILPKRFPKAIKRSGFGPNATLRDSSGKPLV